MQQTYDDLYAKSKNGELFPKLMDIVLSRENILLAYRNIKSNHGSRTPGTDKLDIRDIGRLQPDEVIGKVRYIVAGTPHGYRPKPVRRKDIPKPNGTTRPLGIPCIWDRLIQQCIKQVMEPICEAKFSDNSYGFRPQRSVEHAIQSTYRLIQRSNLHYIVEFDIKGFFDNVNHAKLIRQIWAVGIHDTHLIYVVRKILTAPIKMPDGSMEYPNKGTPQGGIISPLLAKLGTRPRNWRSKAYFMPEAGCGRRSITMKQSPGGMQPRRNRRQQKPMQISCTKRLSVTIPARHPLTLYPVTCRKNVSKGSISSRLARLRKQPRIQRAPPDPLLPGRRSSQKGCFLCKESQ